MDQETRQINFAFIGFGRVGRAFARLLIDRQKWLLKTYGIEWKTTGITTKNHGTAIDHNGLPVKKILGSWKRHSNLEQFHNGPACASPSDFIRQCGADVLFEMSILDLSGEPAATYIREALGSGLHVITTNKGPVATHFSKLTRLAKLRDVRFLYEGTVMDGMPVFNMLRQFLPATKIRSLRGIFNSTTNYILTQMEQGTSFEEALAYAKNAGVTEADPTLDLEGWDAAMKLSISIQAMMGGNVKPKDIERSSISEETGKTVRAAVRRHRRLRLVSRAYRQGGRVIGKVELQELEVSDPLAAVRSMGNILILNTDTMRELALMENNPSIDQTAFAMFSDLISLL
ncbi:MAG TPA: homoserine dehydrogenase [Acidobacteriota bacterium]|nr:homoserine dehydrogenase [Acidobacteriota bacterium]